MNGQEKCKDIDGKDLDCLDCPMLSTKDCSYWRYVSFNLDAEWYIQDNFSEEEMKFLQDCY